MSQRIRKYYVFTTLIVLLGCKSKLVDISNFNSGANDGKYFKDINKIYDPYIGTWETKIGDETMQVVLWKSKKEFSGTYYIDVIKGRIFFYRNFRLPSEEMICSTNRLYSNGFYLDHNILATTTTGSSIAGSFIDNCLDTGEYIKGQLIMTILNPEAPNLRAKWLVKRKNVPYPFRLFTDAELVKVK